MKSKIYQFLKSITPPIIWNMIEILISGKYGWFGNYSSWEDTKSICNGYNSDNILNKVKESLLKVKNGEVAYERDSVVFDKIEYSWPLLTSLLYIAAQSEEKLNILDFGGSLGSTYFQNRKILTEITNMKWNIVEQKSFVECGKQYFESEELKFYYSIKDCLKDNKPDVVILSSVIQYIENYKKLIIELINLNVPYILVDLTPFLFEGKDRITIQYVKPQIYKASYPVWFFNEEDFLNLFLHKYDCIIDFNCELGNSLLIDNKEKGRYKGFLFKKKEK